MPLTRLLIAPALSLASAIATADVIRVGPQESIHSIAQASRVARDGDTVLIMPGTYRGDVATWNQRSLTIRGPGERPVLIADGKSAEDKAIWVIRNGHFRIDNIEFRGARVPQGNGAGIRFEAGRLELEQCVFRDNQMGLLTSNQTASELFIEDSQFSSAPKQLDSLPHLIYVGSIARFEMRGSRLEAGYRGHLVKSRARNTTLLYNWIVDGHAGSASYEVDLPNGGDVLLIGNVIGQSASSENLSIIAYGAEGMPWTTNRLRLAHNTVINEAGPTAYFLRTWPDRWRQGTTIMAYNNLLLGAGHIERDWMGPDFGNRLVALPDEPARNTPDALRHTAQHLPQPTPFSSAAPPPDLAPDAEFTWPAGIRPTDRPRQWIPGAFQATE